MKHCRFVSLILGLLGILAVLTPSGLALATGSEGGFEQEVDGYRIKLIFDGQPKTGQNEIQIKISDSGGSPVRGAELALLPVQLAGGHADDAPGSHGKAEAAHSETLMEEQHDQHSEGEPSASDAHTVDPSHANQTHVDGQEDAGSHAAGEKAGHAEANGHSQAGPVLLKESQEGGLYTGKVEFLEPGDWTVRVRLLVEEKIVVEDLEFVVAVIAGGPNWTVLLGFLGLNITILSVAAVVKPKPAESKPAPAK